MTGFEVNDRRGQTRPGPELNRSRLVRNGMTVQRAKEETGTGLPFQNPNRNKSKDEQTLTHLRAQRLRASRMSRTASAPGAASVQMATGRPRDPMWYYKQNNIPFDFNDPEQLQKIRQFCNTPDAPITMADGSIRPLGQILPGDEVKGWDYNFVPFEHPIGLRGWNPGYGGDTGNGGRYRRYRSATVLAIQSRQAPALVRVTMESDRQITCTPDHQWANPYYGTQVQYDSPYPPKPTTEIMATEYWPAQLGHDLLDVTGARMDRIISIEPIDGGQVISLQTTTGNYVAWGYASKNCRILYTTHPLIAACTDIYAKFPLQGIHLECKDSQVTDFYSDLFLDQLKYEDHLLRMNREYWLVGETWSLGGWNETLGIWEGDEVINPDNVEVESSVLLGEPRFLMELPESLRNILQTRTPHWQYQQLVTAYPELVNFIGEGEGMPVSNIVLKQLMFEGDTFSNRGIPILMRGMRTIIQEEMLMSAMDAIADRLYTPLILTKLGATAQDLGTTVPWIPDQDEMEEFNFALDAALAADFRALTYHWAIDMTAVLGRENVPDLTNDFDRIDDRLLMVYGLSRTMLTGANAGETYAADALNRDVVTQLMSHDQRMHQQFFKERAEIVAEAQEHFDYEVRGGKRYLITEDIYEVDEDGNGRIVQKPKLLVPRLGFKVLNLADEQVDRDFREALNEAGVPVPYKARVQGLGMDFDEMVEQRSAEEVQLTLAQAETDKKKYLGLKAAGLPIPDELRAKFDPKAIEMGGQNQPNSGGMPAVTPSLGQIPLDLPGLAPNQEDVQAALDDPGAQATQLPPDIDEDQDGLADVQEEGDDVPPESNEQRGRMPKAASLRKTAALPKFGIREVTAQHYVPVDNSEEKRPRDYRPAGKFATPKHVGMSYHLAQRIPKEHLANPRSITDNETESDHLK